VGYRSQPVFVPAVCARGTANPADAGWEVVAEHPLAQGLTRGGTLKKTYYDLITVEPGPKGTLIARGVPSGQPVVVCGNAGGGRYVACGLCLGLGRDEKDAELTPDEGRLLENAVRWAAGR
jgi:hypothetical protein